jgi:regulator of RNase E activity RraA
MLLQDPPSARRRHDADSEAGDNWSPIEQWADVTTALACDALDQLGRRHQWAGPGFAFASSEGILVGRCRTTQWEGVDDHDPSPYELELQAVDGCRPGDVFIAAASGTGDSGIWGELLSTAARNSGCVGAVVDGFVRDTRQMNKMNFPCVARGISPLDSQHRQRVAAVDVPVEIGGVTVRTGDIVVADPDGVVFVPSDVADEVLRLAKEKIGDESLARKAILNGMSAVDAYERYGVL